jgi:hypothetical protein
LGAQRVHKRERVGWKVPEEGLHAEVVYHVRVW